MLEILTTNLADRKFWHELINKSCEILQDIHFSPEYLSIYEKTYGVKAICLKKTFKTGIIYQPLIIRNIPNTEYNDLTSAYGYGGPLTSIKGSYEITDLLDYESDFKQWAKSVNAISEYCMLHPLLSDFQKKLIPKNTCIKYRKKIVNINLKFDLNKIWSKVEERQRKAILSARKKGIIVKKSSGNEIEFKEFHKQYLNTMEDVGANQFWRFPENYFRNCYLSLGRKKVIIFKAYDKEKCIASAIHLYCKNNLYYHFSCSIREERKKNAMPLLLFESILWAKSMGIKNFHMGGGRTDGEDDLFTFKKSFGGDTISSFFYCRKLNMEIYDKLTYENLNKNKQIDKNYFPLYRA